MKTQSSGSHSDHCVIPLVLLHLAPEQVGQGRQFLQLQRCDESELPATAERLLQLSNDDLGAALKKRI